MPTVLRTGPYRFLFYAGDREEPPHIHVERDHEVCKFWLDPIRLQGSGGFTRTEIRGIHELVMAHRDELLEGWRVGMTALTFRIDAPTAKSVSVSEDTLSVDLSDGRTISVPIEWFPRLLHATEEEREKWCFIGNGQGIHWEDIDEDISVTGLLAGTPAGESQASLKRWLDQRVRRAAR